MMYRQTDKQTNIPPQLGTVGVHDPSDAQCTVETPPIGAYPCLHE